jgi:hypothetical protein
MNCSRKSSGSFWWGAVDVRDGYWCLKRNAMTLNRLIILEHCTAASKDFTPAPFLILESETSWVRYIYSLRLILGTDIAASNEMQWIKQTHYSREICSSKQGF